MNATSEVPSDSRTSLLVRIAALGVSYFGLTILLLSLFDTDYNPISQVASDYGVGRFAIAMNLGFFVGGIGMLAFAWAISRQRVFRRSRASPGLFSIAGLVLIMDSYFTTNLEGAPATLHGTIHGFGGLIFFITAPIGVLLLSRGFGRLRLALAAVGLVVGFAMLASNAGIGGLAERFILLVIFSTVIAASIQISKATAPSQATP